MGHLLKNLVNEPALWNARVGDLLTVLWLWLDLSSPEPVLGRYDRADLIYSLLIGWEPSEFWLPESALNNEAADLLEREKGLEPSTSTLARLRSTN